jgi:hypothetical protein
LVLKATTNEAQADEIALLKTRLAAVEGTVNAGPSKEELQASVSANMIATGQLDLRTVLVLQGL